MRSTLLAQITTNLSGSSVAVSSELPFENSGSPLYIKNKKRFYLGEENISKVMLYKTLDGTQFDQTTTTILGYLCVDAKNPLTDIGTIISNLISAKSSIANTVEADCSYDTEIEGDDLTYIFEYSFVTV